MEQTAQKQIKNNSKDSKSLFYYMIQDLFDRNAKRTENGGIYVTEFIVVYADGTITESFI